MRMWLVDPVIMCRRHLLGEHVECHMFLGTIKKGKNIQGYLDRGLFDPGLLQERHDDLAAEINSRGYNHKSPIILTEENYYNQLSEEIRKARFVDREQSLKDLLDRCLECRKGYEERYGTYREEITYVLNTREKMFSITQYLDENNKIWRKEPKVAAGVIHNFLGLQYDEAIFLAQNIIIPERALMNDMRFMKLIDKTYMIVKEKK